MKPLPSTLNEEHPNRVISAQYRFAKRRYEYESSNGRKVEDAMVAAILS